ncbi:MAG TPA: cysteine desulfurase family protein [bacterium]|nr:cysteine desulfurase family protein [bacterium]
MDRINLDYASAAPVDERVIAEMGKYWREAIGNPSSVYGAGEEAREVVELARTRVAGLIGAEPRHVIFTSGATEANNLAVIGTALRNKAKGNKVVISALEHMSVLNPAKSLTKQGFELVTVPVDGAGVVDLDKLRAAVDSSTALISVMFANGEIGTIEPVKEIARIARAKGVPFHADATVAAGKVPINVAELDVDLLTVSSNDMYGPQGAGALYVGPRAKMQPVILGGGQERGLRSGTENLAGVAGFGKAAELAALEMADESRRLTGLRDRLIEGVLGSIGDAYLTGHRVKRLPHHASFRFEWVEGESIILFLDMKGITGSTGSACTSKTLQSSHVLLALGLEHGQSHGSLVFTLGRWSGEADVDKAIAEVPPIIKRLREISPLTGRGKAEAK